MRDYRLRATRRPGWYDLGGAVQFNLLTFLGLREHHYLLDIGCGPLRVGRLLIMYLLPGRYFGIDVAKWAIDAAIEHEVGKDFAALKNPTFSIDGEFRLSEFGQQFDFILAQGVLCYMGTRHMRKCFAEAKSVMRKESLLLATYFPGPRSYMGDAPTYPEAQQHTFQFIRAVAGEEGLRAMPLSWPYLDSRWLLFVDPSSERDLSGWGCDDWFRNYEGLIEEARGS